MLNDEEISTQANDHRTLRLAQAEQQRLAQALVASHSHPVITWVGRLVSRWGRPAAMQKKLAYSAASQASR